MMLLMNGMDYTHMKKENKKINEELKKRSGNVASQDPLVSLLYSLMRDYCAPGVIENLVREIEMCHSTTVYSNGWLANYAKDLVNRLYKIPNNISNSPSTFPRHPAPPAPPPIRVIKEDIFSKKSEDKFYELGDDIYTKFVEDSMQNK